MLTKEPCDYNLVFQIDLPVVRECFVIPTDTFQMNITVIFLTENEKNWVSVYTSVWFSGVIFPAPNQLYDEVVINVLYFQS